MPQTWRDDPDRGRPVAIPPQLGPQTKPQLALTMRERALDAGGPAAWVVGDDVSGSAGALRRAREARGQAYVLAVRRTEQPSRWPPYGAPGPRAIPEVATAVSADAWPRVSWGEGAPGPRRDAWAFVPLRPALRADGGHSALLRRPPVRTDEVA